MKNLTKNIILAVVVVLILFDIYVYINGGVDSTISRVVLGWSDNPIIPFGVGVVCGHLFWPQKIKEK